MAAQPIGSLRAELSAGHAQFASDMKKAKDAVRKNASGMSAAMKKVGDTFTRTARTLTSFRSIAAGAAMLAGMTYAVKKNLEYADSIAKTADKVGITTKALQEYRYIAERSGVDTNKLDEAFGAFAKRIGELRMGTGTLYTILNKNNQALRDQLVAADNTTEALDIYFEALKNTENQSDRAALSAAAFGRGAGVAMTNMIDDIDVLRERFERLGVEIDEKLLRESEAAKDNIDDLGLVIRNSLARALIALGPPMGQAAADMATWVSENKEFISQDIPGKIREMAESVKNFTTSAEFKAIMEYWEIAAGAVIGWKIGGPKGALFGAGAGGWYSAIKDLREMFGGKTPGINELEEKLKDIKKEIEETIASYPEWTNKALNVVGISDDTLERLRGIKGLREDQAKIEAAIAEYYKEQNKNLPSAKAAPGKVVPDTGPPPIDTTIDTNTKAIDKQIEALKTQSDTFGMTSKEVALYHLKMQGATKGQLELAASILDTIAAQEEKEQAEKDAEAAHKLQVETYLQDEAAKWAELEEYEKEYAKKQAEFQDAHKRATLTAQQYELQQLKSLYDEYATYIDDKTKLDEWYAAEKARILGKSVEKEKSDISELKFAIEGWGRDSADAIVEFARTGEKSFGDMIDMIDSMIDDLLKMMVYQNITRPIFGAISGGLGSLFGFAKGNAFQGGNVIPFARGGIVDRPTATPFARGGVVDIPTVFPMARGIGLMGEAGPEAVMPLTRIGGDLGVKAYGGGTEVNIYNNVGADVTTQERATADGSKAIDVYIDQAVAKKLGQFGSQSNRAMRTNYGVRTQLTGR